MIIRVVGDDVRVDEGDDCTRLHVTTTQSQEATGAALKSSGLGLLVDDAANLDVDVLRAKASAHGVAEDWSQKWSAMIDYARVKGWLTPDGKSVRAHIELVEKPSLRDDAPERCC